jgi:hypothetical protein
MSQFCTSLARPAALSSRYRSALREAVDPDVLAHVVGGHLQGQRVDGALGGGVQGAVRQPREGGDRAGVDDGGLAVLRVSDVREFA